MVVGNVALYPKKTKNLPSKVREQIFYIIQAFTINHPIIKVPYLS